MKTHPPPSEGGSAASNPSPNPSQGLSLYPFLNNNSSVCYFAFFLITISLGAESRSINPELWQACAGPLVNLPPAATHVIYFPQGHSEQVHLTLSFSLSLSLSVYFYTFAIPNSYLSSSGCCISQERC